MRRNISNSGQSVSRFGGQELSFALLLLAAYPANRLPAQDLANNSGALFLVLPVGAQAVGMGQTAATLEGRGEAALDRKSTRLNSSHGYISYAVFCLKKKKKQSRHLITRVEHRTPDTTRHLGPDRKSR